MILSSRNVSEKMSLMGEIILMSTREVKRVCVIERLVDRLLTVREAAELLEVSVRHTYRLKARYLSEKEKGLVHKSRGRKPKHTIAQETRQLIIKLYQSKYSGSNYKHFSELLAEYEEIHISSSSVRRILTGAGIKSVHKRRRRCKVYQPRQRKSQEGMLIQMDASKHQWLEECEPFTLSGAIDDATGKVVGATFRPNEDLKGYLQITHQMIKKHGIPLSIYTDRHQIFFPPDDKLTVEQELDGVQASLSQYGKAMEELGITHIKAHSPQAKGRIERLWNTLQDRLTIELRLRKIKNIDEANAILPKLISKHNTSFAKPAQNETKAFMPYTHKFPLSRVLCFREGIRKVGSGQTISLNKKLYKLKVTDSPRILPLKTSVEVRRSLENELFVRSENTWFDLIPCDPVQNSVPKKTNEKAGSLPYKPAKNHPWRTKSKEVLN